MIRLRWWDKPQDTPGVADAQQRLLRARADEPEVAEIVQSRAEEQHRNHFGLEIVTALRLKGNK